MRMEGLATKEKSCGTRPTSLQEKVPDHLINRYATLQHVYSIHVQRKEVDICRAHTTGSMSSLNMEKLSLKKLSLKFE